jgi:prepilin-type N-terminal cleavage/methylation domain-containing protein
MACPEDGAAVPPSGGPAVSRRRLWRTARRRADEGFGLVEMLVSMTILALVMLTMAGQLGAVLKVARNNRNRSVAANLAGREMDIVRNLDFPTLSAQIGQTVSTATVDAFDYTVTRTLELISQTSTSGACDGGSGNSPAFVRVSIAVTWKGMGSISPVRTQTVITPPVGSYDPTTGHIGVKLLDRNAQPLSGQTVTLSGAGSGTETTTNDGCAFFAYRAAGTYAVALSSAGYVDSQGTAGPSSPAVVTSGQTTNVAFDYDQAATITATLAPPSSAYTLPTGVAVSLANGRLLPEGVKEIAGTGTTRSLTNLFPFTDGYEHFAGECADADPEGLNTSVSPATAFYPGAQRAAAVAVTPLGTASVTIPLVGVDVTVRDTSGAVQSGAIVTPYHRADSGCTALSLGTVTADANGVAHIALPYGSWAFKAVKGSKSYAPSNPPPTVTLTPSMTTATAPPVVIS